MDGRAELARVDAREVLRRSLPIVDLRSPSEHADDAIPGSRNIPLFDDVERALVGTLWKQRSHAAAFDEASRIVRARIHGLVAEVEALGGA
jgi:tRNA 2-selenouridine synthase